MYKKCIIESQYNYVYIWLFKKNQFIKKKEANLKIVVICDCNYERYVGKGGGHFKNMCFFFIPLKVLNKERFVLLKRCYLFTNLTNCIFVYQKFPNNLKRVDAINKPKLTSVYDL